MSLPEDLESGVTRRYADEGIPEGSWIDGETVTRDIDEQFDFVVVGSGAAGAVAAHRLACAGFSVAMVEEGPWIKTRDVGEDVYGIFKRAMRDGATQAIEGRAFMPLLQGRCVGGSTLVNSAIAWRTPDDVLHDWSKNHGLGDTLSEEALAPHFDALERDLSVRSVADDVLGENNASFLAEAKKRGMEANAMKRYEKGCRGEARCLTGCPHGAKQGMNVSYIPWALERGARLFSSCKVERVIVESGRATGVLATTTHVMRARATRRRVHLRARHGVFVAASTIQTPNILRRSGLRSRDIGEHFQAHPGIACGGAMASPVHMEFGASQGAESIHFRKTNRFKIETISMPPELLAARMPGIGSELMGKLDGYSNVAVWAVQLRAEAIGTVRSGWGGRDVVNMTLTRADLTRARSALVLMARMMFDHGATEIWPGVYGLPPVMKSPDQIKLIEEGPLDPRAYGFVATHLFGAARMGPDPKTSVVGLDFCTHEAKGLFVVDSSVFPTNLGVNPQHSIMAVARCAADRVAADTKRSAVA